jgi:hypothetical protein
MSAHTGEPRSGALRERGRVALDDLGLRPYLDLQRGDRHTGEKGVVEEWEPMPDSATARRQEAGVRAAATCSCSCFDSAANARSAS